MTTIITLLLGIIIGAAGGWLACRRYGARVDAAARALGQ